jgi:gamma-butyrobetaine dioxygenase
MDSLQIEHGSPPRVLWLSQGPDGETRTPLPALWLRARSQVSSERDAMTGQRLNNPHQFDDHLSLTAAAWGEDASRKRCLNLSFSDGFSGPFDPDELLAGTRLTEGTPSPKAWRSDLDPRPEYHWPELARDDRVLYAALHDFIVSGVLLIRDTPLERDAVLSVARRFGHVRTTNFGAYFEVYTRPQGEAIDLSYQSVALGPHTDNPYRAPVPGIQLLHCLQNETSGGLSTLVDSLAAVAQLRTEDPRGFELLAQVPVRFEHRDAEAELVSICPVIETNGSGEMVGVHYSPRLDDIPVMSEADTQAYQSARRRLGELFNDPAFELRFLLEPGHLMMFDNNRVLHGRTSYNPEEGHRQLQGCYIDRDGPRSSYRVLKRRFGPLPGTTP